MCVFAGQMRVIAGSVDSTGPWRRAARRSMATWQWLTRGLITTLTTITPPSFCTTQRYSHGPLQECLSQLPTRGGGFFWFCFFWGFFSPNFMKSNFLEMSPDARLSMVFSQLHKYGTCIKNGVNIFNQIKLYLHSTFHTLNATQSALTCSNN